MREGYIKLWRKSLDNGWLKNHDLWVFWSYCLLRANHTSVIVKIGFQEIPLQAGQFIFGRVQAAKDLAMSEWKIRNCLDFLKKAGNLTIKTTNKFSIITIVNWDTYQGDSIAKPPAKPPTNRQQPATEKNVKNDKEESLCPFQDILDLFNEKLPDLPRVRKLTPRRRKALNARWREDKERQSLEWWGRFFEYVAGCLFLMGQNRNGWKASFDWIMEPSNFVKIVEGNYETHR